MINYVCCCISKCSSGIVPKAHESGTRNIQQKEVLEPERFDARLSSCFCWIPVQSVNSDNTIRQVESVLCCSLVSAERIWKYIGLKVLQPCQLALCRLLRLGHGLLSSCQGQRQGYLSSKSPQVMHMLHIIWSHAPLLDLSSAISSTAVCVTLVSWASRGYRGLIALKQAIDLRTYGIALILLFTALVLSYIINPHSYRRFG